MRKVARNLFQDDRGIYHVDICRKGKRKRISTKTGWLPLAESIRNFVEARLEFKRGEENERSRSKARKCS